MKGVGFVFRLETENKGNSFQSKNKPDPVRARNSFSSRGER